MSTEIYELAQSIPLVDHHVHGPLRHDVDRGHFEMLLTESDRPIPAGTTVFDSQVGVAVRRHCSPLLGLEPGCGADEYWMRRQELSPDHLGEEFLRKAGVDHWVIDTGFGSESIWSPEKVARHTGAEAHEIVRLESLLEEIAPSCTAEDLQSRFESAVSAASHSSRGWKSVVAYRYGFDFDPTRPSRSEVRDAADRWLADIHAGGTPRVSDPVLHRMALYTACETGKPIQLHVGFGDPDIDLRRCDPALLMTWLKHIEGSGSAIMLLHCYPFHRNAGYLAHVFPHVYIDVGLAINYSGAASPHIIRESMEMAPFTRVLYSSDAWGPPELHYLGSVLWRRGTGRVLSRWVEDGEWTAGDARRAVELIGYENALRVYELGS